MELKIGLAVSHWCHFSRENDYRDDFSHNEDGASIIILQILCLERVAPTPSLIHTQLLPDYQ